jgi:uncharacterized protein YfaS (alpha-2-macroglobulin family)
VTKSPSFAVLVGIVVACGLFALGVRDEVPMASAEGVVLMEENGKPLAYATVILETPFPFQDQRTYRVLVKADDKGRFVLPRIPAGECFIEAFGKAHSLERKAITLKSGRNEPLILMAEPTEPYMELTANIHAFTEREEPVVLVNGFSPENEVEFKIYQANVESIIAKGGFQGLLSSLEWWSRRTVPSDDSFRLVHSFVHSITTRDVEGLFTEHVRLPRLPYGMYLIVASVEGVRPQATWLTSTNVALITKRSGDETLCFVSDVNTGKPVPGVSLTMYWQGQPLGSPLKTDERGLARIKIPALKGSGNILYYAKNGEAPAFVSEYVYETEDSGKPLSWRAFLQTDRPIYRPGDTLHYKGILRELQGADFQFPTGSEVQVEIRDPNEELLERKTLPLSPRGTFTGELRLRREAVTGPYSLTCRYQGSTQTLFVPVVAYRKPEFSVKVLPEKPYVVQGDRVEVQVEARYYFGAPVPGAEVRLWVYRAPYYGPVSGRDWGEGEEADEEYYSGGEWVSESVGKTDASGRARFTINTSDLPEGGYHDWTYTLLATVIDVAHRSGDGEGSLRVARGEFSVFLEAERYVFAPNSEVTVVAHVLSNETNQPLSGKEISFTARGYDWREGARREILARGRVSTDASGKAVWHFEARAKGAILVEAEGEDSRRNRIADKLELYAAVGEGGEGVPAEEAPILLLDKSSYNVGDTLTALVTTRAYGGTALVTVEGDRVMEARLVPLESSATVISLPVPPSWVPNVYLSVTFVKDKKFFTVEKRVSVDEPSSALRVEVIPERTEYQPRESVVYTIRTFTPDGKPVPAECSLSVVDESIYALQEDTQDIYDAFYPKRGNQVRTRYSFEEIYFGQADKGGRADIRTRFLDTAKWIPVIQTDQTGTARVTVPLPDNLTTWRATVKAITDATQVGTGVARIRVSKPLMVRLETPRFLTQGDRFTVMAMVHNERERPAMVTVSLRASGGEVGSPLERRVRVGAGQSERLEWDVFVPRPGSFSVQVVGVADNGDRDGMKIEVPVLPYGRTVADRFSGEVAQQEARVPFTLWEGSVREATRVSVVITPSLVSSLLDGLEELVGYPYGCTEQTMSRMLPAVITAQVVSQLGLEGPPLLAELPDIVAESYSRLARFQHWDGGWGWWESDDSDLWMTAYVLEGLARGAQGGFPPPSRMLEEGLRFAEEALQKKPAHPSDPPEGELLLCRALTLHHRVEEVRKYLQGVDINAVNDPKRLILLLDILTHLKEEPVKRDRVLSKLVSQAIVQGSMAHWPEGWYGVETTAFALSVVAQAYPRHPVIPKVIRWLLLQRRGGTWMSTRDTARALLGIAEYAKAVREIKPSYTLGVRINGHEIYRLSVTPQTLLSPALRLEIPPNALQPGRNVLTLVKEGEGMAYYSVEVRQVIPQGSEGRILRESDLMVERSFHRLSVRLLDDGTLRLMPSETAVREVRSGELLRCKIRITSEKAREYFMLECPIPAGCEITDPGSEERDFWNDWWTSTDVRDDKIVFFFRELPSGTSEVEFTLRAGPPGEYRALPLTLNNMYDPDVRAEAGALFLRIKP